MKTNYQFHLTIISFALLIACNAQIKKNPENLVDSSFKKHLILRQIGKSKYFISIPANYKLEERNGPDFSVYYFKPADSTDIKYFSGGFYFGNYPSFFKPINNQCQTTSLQSKILNKLEEWTQYTCDSSYSVQVIINSGDDEGWNEKIHAFGNAKSKEDVDKALLIFSTLLRK